MLCEITTYKEAGLSDDYLSLFCEKNSDGTKNLRLKGNELYFRNKRRIRDGDMKLIANFLFGRPFILKLDIPYNDISDLGLQTLIDNLLSQENYVTYLNLTCCNITHTGLENLCNCWPRLKLKTLRLTGNKLGSAAGPPLENLLRNLKTLEVLDLGDTNQTLSSIPFYCSSIQSGRGGNTTLKVLDISTIVPDSAIYQYAPSHLADKLGETLRLNSSLVEIHMQKCQFDGHDIELLLNGLKYNKTLKLLDIGYNRISNFGAELIAEWLKTRPSLQGLNIAGNSIGAIGGNALSFGLPFTVLRLLDISQNQIPDESLCNIVTTIKKKYRMRILYLWGNEIGPNSLKELNKQIKAGVYSQENVDFKIFYDNDKLQAAKYPSNQYKTKYYCQLKHGEVQELRIKRNRVESRFCEHRAKIKHLYYDRIQEMQECKKEATYLPKDWEQCNLEP